MRHAPPRRPLPPRPRQALPAHGQAGAGAGAPHHCDDDVPRDGHAVLAGAGGGGNEGTRVTSNSPRVARSLTKAELIKDNDRLAEEAVRLRRELTEALEQQTATAEILRVISRSPTDIQLMLETIAQNAARVCGASDAIIRRVEGDAMTPAAHFGTIPVSNAPVPRPITRNSV